MFWMMIIARGVAGFGAGGEYPVCGTSAAEAADETVKLRKQRGILVAVATDFAIDLVRAQLSQEKVGLGSDYPTRASLSPVLWLLSSWPASIKILSLEYGVSALAWVSLYVLTL